MADGTRDQAALEPPKRTSIADPGAHDLDSSDSDDHFSDAQSGLEQSSGNGSPIVSTKRAENVDSDPRSNTIEQDAEPDEVVAIPEPNNGDFKSPLSISTTPGGQPIPITLVEKVDPSTPSHGEIPGTIAHEKRAADAVPDMVVRSGDRSPVGARSRATSTPGDLPIPTTKIEKVDNDASYGEVPGTKAFELRKGDAQPDVVEQVGDLPRSPTSRGARSSNISHSRRKSSGAGKRSTGGNYDEEMDGAEGDGFGDEFDDFEQGEDDAEFGDFDDGFQEADFGSPEPMPARPSFPVLDFLTLDSSERIQVATEPFMESLFPPDSIDTSALPPVSSENPVFLSPRSASLWAQLVAPPPLQPPNWIRSRIRRLFLVSLGVPVDLDEILPASKQKKLILPSIHLNPSSGSPRTSTDSRSISRLKQSDGNASNTSLDSQGKPSRSDSRRRKGPAPAPQLDLVSARQLCTITEEALNGFTFEELKNHVDKLEAMQVTAKDVLDYWTKKTDEKLGDREAFEGVIENLVKHARKVRK